MVAFDTGVFTVSLDFELAWGSFDSGNHERYLEHSRVRGDSPFEVSRRVVAGILELFRVHDVAATWATVGHLFLEGCHREGDRKHPDMPRARHAWFPDDWYALDPCGDAHSSPLWYGRDLVEQVRDATPKHDIGSHSFSHVIFGDPGCSREVAEAELAKCVSLAEGMGIRMSSFVFPRNAMGHVDLLPRHGFRVTREGTPFWYMNLPNRNLRRVAHLADDVLALPPPTGLPRRLGGLWVVPASMFLQSMDGPRALIPARSRVDKAVRGIERAIRKREIFHLLFHPINFYTSPTRMLGVLDRVLAHAARRRDDGALRVMTMADLADHCDAAQSTSSR